MGWTAFIFVLHVREQALERLACHGRQPWLWTCAFWLEAPLIPFPLESPRHLLHMQTWTSLLMLWVASQTGKAHLPTYLSSSWGTPSLPVTLIQISLPSAHPAQVWVDLSSEPSQLAGIPGAGVPTSSWTQTPKYLTWTHGERGCFSFLALELHTFQGGGKGHFLSPFLIFNLWKPTPLKPCVCVCPSRLHCLSYTRVPRPHGDNFPDLPVSFLSLAFLFSPSHPCYVWIKSLVWIANFWVN